MNYVQAVLLNKSKIEEINDYIEKWHESKSNEPIYTYLGLNEQDYALWVQNDNYLFEFFIKRRLN